MREITSEAEHVAPPLRALVPNRFKFMLLVVVTVALLFVLLVRVMIAVNTTGTPAGSMGATAPNLTISTWNDPGTPTISLAALRRSPVVISFWQASCLPCQEEQTFFNQTYRQFSSYGVVFLGVALDTSQADGMAFIKKYDVTYPTGAVPSEQVATEYGLPGTPVTVLVNAQGKIVEKIVGQTDPKTLVYYIQKLLLD